MDFKRFLKHLFTTQTVVKRYFPKPSIERITSAIEIAESQHRGEICVVIEASLDPAQLWGGISPRHRALEIFSHSRVWDTELNSGVLIYVLFADRAVEIIADRGIHDKTAQNHCWKKIVTDMENAFASGQFERGALDGIQAVAAELVNYFPSNGSNPNELPNNVVII